MISTMRGSQSRYLVALAMKFNEYVPPAHVGMSLSIPPAPGSEIYESGTGPNSATARNEATPFDSMSAIGMSLQSGGSAGHSQYGDLKHSQIQGGHHTQTHSPMTHHGYVYATSGMPYPDSVAAVGMVVTSSVAPSGMVVQDMYGLSSSHPQTQGYGD
jgi:hypothetical protein